MSSLPSKEENQIKLVSERNNQKYFLKQHLVPTASLYIMHVVTKGVSTHTDSFLYNVVNDAF